MTPFYDDGRITIWHGDVIDVIDRIPAGSIDMVFTSPPYNLGVSAGGGFGHYSDDARHDGRGGHGKWSGGPLADGYDDHDDAMDPAEYERWQRRVLAALWSRLTGTGAIFYNHKPRVQAKTLWLPLVLNPQLPLRQIITWTRGGGMNFAPTHFVPTYEWIMVFAKPDWRLKSKAVSGMGDVWYVPAEQNSAHPAPFPAGLPARAIEAAAPSIVLDPFMGSGSTLRAAKDAGIRAIGIDKSARYCQMAADRLNQASLFEPAVAAPDQGQWFGGDSQ